MMAIEIQKILRLINIIGLMCLVTWNYAQTYPVQTTINVIQPIGVSLAELQLSNSPKIQTSILLTDLNKPLYNVKLRLTIEGRDLILTTKSNANVPTITLYPGQPLLLDQNSLLPYLSIDNLNIDAPNPKAFISGGMRLKEGYYNICIEAVDANYPNGLRVSNIACTNVLFSEYDPPILMPPVFANTILFGNQPPPFQQGLFTWQPMHFGFFPVEYQLNIYRTPQGANGLPSRDLSTNFIPFLSVRTQNIFYNLSPTDPPLQWGEVYYAEVIVKPVNYPAIFKNNGKSQLVPFTLSASGAEQCDGPEEYKGKIDRLGIALQWKTYTHCDQYVTEYKEENSADLQYQVANIGVGGDLVDTIKSVISNRTYILRTGCPCGLDTMYSDTIRLTFVRPKAQVQPYECGILQDSVLGIENGLPVLNENDTIVASDFKVIVRRVAGSNGVFTGTGHIEIPYFKYARVNAVFKNIKVNDEYRMTGGEIKLIGIGQNVLSDDVLEFLDSLDKVLHIISDGLGDLNERLDSLQAIRDMLNDGMPPWLIDSIKIIEEAIANATDEHEKAELMKKLKELEHIKAQWELMYINIVIETIEALNDDYEQNKTKILEDYNLSLANVKNEVQFYNLPEEEEDTTSSKFQFKGEIKVVKYSVEEFENLYPEIGGKIRSFANKDREFVNMKVIEKLDLELNKDSLQVLVLLSYFLRVNKEIIPKFKEEFIKYNWDLEVIQVEKEAIISKYKFLIVDALESLYWHLN